MHNITHKDFIKLAGVALLVVATLIAVGFSTAVRAQPLDMEISRTVSKEVACFAYSRFIGLGKSTNAVHLKRIGKASETAGAVYRLGYIEGLVNGLATANSKRLGGYGVALKHAAKYLYKAEGCTVNTAI